MLSAFYTAFRLLPFTWKLGAIAITLGAFAVENGVVYFRGYNHGWSNAIAGVASRNSEAINAVRGAVSKVDDCSGNGGVWDTVNGVCR